MGLDIYLRKCADLELAQKAQREASEECDKAWSFGGLDYEELSQEQIAQARSACKAIRAKAGCDEDGRHLSVQEEDGMPSQTDPEHLFRIGYFRSSYNEGGIERVMSNLGLPGLAQIFGEPEEYEFKPDWEACLARAQDAINGYKAHLESPAGKFRIVSVSPMWDCGASSEKEALDMFVGEMEKNRPEGWDCFSNRDGHFWMGGMTVRAVVTKKFDPPAANDPIGRLVNRPGVFLVCDRQQEPGKLDWYLAALMIVKETIEYVLSRPDRSDYYLTWSG